MPENRLLLIKLLGAVGFDVREAANGSEAVDVWHAWRPDLIFMDMRMPVMDGREATRRIRAAEAVPGTVATGSPPSGSEGFDVPPPSSTSARRYSGTARTTS
jgi:CheY-like chemotaxis protein